MTMRLYEYIQAQCATRTFTSVAREVGLSEKTIRNVFNEAV
jgi:predicted transcriptional regulator